MSDKRKQNTRHKRGKLVQMPSRIYDKIIESDLDFTKEKKKSSDGALIQFNDPTSGEETNPVKPHSATPPADGSDDAPAPSANQP